MNQNVFWILLSAMIINNFTLMMFLGLCPFMGVSSRVGTALRMGLANIFVLTINAICAWALHRFVLPSAPYLRLISFIVVIASMVQITEMAIKKLSPALFRQLGIFIPLITTNCAIRGMALWQTAKYDFNLIQGLFYAIGAGLGLTLALVMMASIRENSELSAVPSLAKGTALSLIIAASLSLAFMGFSGLGSAS